jgi:hypothetical protein
MEHRGFVIQPVGDRYQVYLPCGQSLKLVLDDHRFKSKTDAEKHIDVALDTLESLIM